MRTKIKEEREQKKKETEEKHKLQKSVNSVQDYKIEKGSSDIAHIVGDVEAEQPNSMINFH